jgi:hypothetical protein
MLAINWSRSRSVRAYLASLIALLIFSLADITPAHAAEFGRRTAGSIPSAGLSADFKRGSRFTAPASGVLVGLCAYIDGLGGAPGQQDVRLALYTDRNGTPATKIVESVTQTIVAGAQPAWACFDTAWVPIAPGEYWIVIHSGGTPGIVRDYADGAANWFGNADAFVDGAATTFGSGNTGSGTLSVYAEYDPQVRISGRTTIGTTPSKGMTANFKRGSSFTLSEPARLEAVSVYLDAHGGASGTAAIRAVLYRDENGVPGAKITESPERLVGTGPGFEADNMPRWRTFPIPPAQLDAGKYWIVLHTGRAGGILRDYADGSGNWAGNADDYVDGASSPFGTASAGNGTVSAFIVYKPGPFTSLRFGRSDVGSAPSKGLSADFMRGSTVLIRSDPPSLVVCSAIYAYLDGNGGATGSQSLRMVLYGAEPLLGNAEYARSDIVTIPAGTPPGWVKFPITPTYLDGQYRFMLHSGAANGVVRDYGGDAPNNWAGEADTFADGSPTELDTSRLTAGTGTLSIYADCVGGH